MKEIDYLKWENRAGYKWETNIFKNLIATTGTAGDCYLLQINKKTEKEKVGFAKREMAWGPLTAIFVKYCGLVHEEILEKIDKEKEPTMYRFDTKVIEDFLSQNLFYWDKPNDRRYLRLNQPLDNIHSFLKKNGNILELHLMEYNKEKGVKIFETFSDLKKRDKAFKEGIKYFPQDCYNLLEALLKQSPYQSEPEYAIKRALGNQSFFLD